MANEKDYPEVLQDLRRIFCEVLVKHDTPKEVAEHWAHEATESVRAEWGGSLVYICKGQSYDLNQRDLQIWSEFNGRNHQELCKKFNITLVWLYKIIKIQRQAMLKDKQGDLFD